MNTFETFVRTSKTWAGAKWFANGMFVVATVILISPHVATYSLAPWLLYVFGNFILIADTYIHKNYQWMYLGLFYSLYNTMIATSRMYEIPVLHTLSNTITQLFT